MLRTLYRAFQMLSTLSYHIRPAEIHTYFNIDGNVIRIVVPHVKIIHSICRSVITTCPFSCCNIIIGDSNTSLNIGDETTTVTGFIRKCRDNDQIQLMGQLFKKIKVLSCCGRAETPEV